MKVVEIKLDVTPKERAEIEKAMTDSPNMDPRDAVAMGLYALLASRRNDHEEVLALSSDLSTSAKDLVKPVVDAAEAAWKKYHARMVSNINQVLSTFA